VVSARLPRASQRKPRYRHVDHEELLGQEGATSSAAIEPAEPTASATRNVK